MPADFNPGHRPSAPLYPDELVYTSVEKVSEYLQLPLPDPVTLSGNTSVNSGSIRIPISGANYRRWGYASGDSVLLYDDADAVGSTLTLTGVQSAGSGGDVWLLAADPSTAYTTSNNAVVQGLSAITESNERGIKKSHVERLIKEKQDYIDVVCRMAWRPRLVTDEYQNFTTFKPYRRRYYTDYVGAIYLHNRGIRRILRLAVWQGDYYREIAAARVNFKVQAIHSFTGSDKIFLCPGANGVATLQNGTTTSKWDGRFGAKNAAEEIARLVNADVDTAKAKVQIGSLTEGNATNNALNISDEFLATSNSDEGDGVVLISSMRDGEDGENSTIAFTNSLSFDVNSTETTTIESTITSTGGGSFTLTDGSNFTDSHGLVFIEGGGGAIHVALCTKSGNVFTVVTDLTSSFNSALGTDVTVKQHRLNIDSVDIERQKDFWSMEDNGAIMFNNVYPFFENHSLKISYIYGERYLDKNIEEACTKLVAREIMMSDDYSVMFPEGTQNIDLNAKVQKIDEEVRRILVPFQESIIVAGMGG